MAPFALNHVDGVEALREVVARAWKDAPSDAKTLHAVAYAFDHGAELAAFLLRSGVSQDKISRNITVKEIAALRPNGLVLLPGLATYRSENATNADFKRYVQSVFPHLEQTDLRTQFADDPEVPDFISLRTNTLAVGLTWKRPPK